MYDIMRLGDRNWTTPVYRISTLRLYEKKFFFKSAEDYFNDYNAREEIIITEGNNG